MRSRTLIPAGLLLLCLLGMGCNSKEAAPSGADVWATLVRFPVSDSLSFDDLQKQVGFKLVLPSYLPQEMRIYDYSGNQTVGGIVWLSEENSWEAFIKISPLASSRWTKFHIQITERQRQEGDLRVDPPYIEEPTTIGQTTVTCYLEPHEFLMTPPPTTEPITPSSPGTPIAINPLPESALSPNYYCFWDTDKLHLRVQFLWSLSEPVPGLITSDMRDEAVKVVASMIEDPYIP